MYSKCWLGNMVGNYIVICLFEYESKKNETLLEIENSATFINFGQYM